MAASECRFDFPRTHSDNMFATFTLRDVLSVTVQEVLVIKQRLMTNTTALLITIDLTL